MSAVAVPSEPARVLARLAPFFRQALALSVVAGLLVLVPVVYMFEVYDRVVASRSHQTLWMLTLLVLLAIVVMAVMEWSRSETLREAGDALDHALAPRVFAAIHDTNLRHAGAAGALPMADLRTLRDFFHAPALNAALELPVALLMLVVLFIISPWLGWLSLAAAVLQTGLSWRNERAVNPSLLAANEAQAQARVWADAALRHAETIAALGMLGHLRQRWLLAHGLAVGHQARASDGAALFQSAGRLLQTTLSSALLGLGVWLLLREQLPGGAGMLIVASMLGGRMLAPLVQVVVQWRAVVQVRAAWARLEHLLRQSPAPEPRMPLPRPSGRVDVDRLVAGASAGAPAVLKGLNLALRPGEMLAVVGPSAAGKTTLARMLMGLWPPLAGCVRLDGVDLATWDKCELGPHLGYLPQEVELLDGTLGENIARFGATDTAALQQAAAAVELQDWISTLPLGHDTPVGPDGVLLSGGQRQRVALARALYGAPAFVVLDEPDASLDEEGHAMLLRVLRALKARGTTCVLMTHLASLLQAADSMLVLQDGAAVAFGPREEVLAAIRAAQAQASAATVAGPAA